MEKRFFRYYGRFGKKEWRDECTLGESKSKVRNRYSIGNTYLEVGNSMRLQGEDLYQSIETKRREDEKFDQLIVMRNSRGRSTDYLKEVRQINR